MCGESIFEELRHFFEYKRLPIILFLVAIIISLPTVFYKWEPLDDLRHRVKLLDPAGLPSKIFDTGMIPENSGQLITVINELHSNVHTKEKVKVQKDYGVLPWWTHEDYKASNFRPLDSFTHWLDYRLYPDIPALIHLHNIIWFGILIFLTTIFYRRFLVPGWAAGLAAVLYLLDDSNCFPTSWIANRNLLIALVFAVMTILAHHKWRQDNSTIAAVLAPICLLCSLLATEAGIATFAYILSYAVTIDRTGRLKRILSLVPALLIIVLWRIVYNCLGHGAFTSGVILDPGREPVRFAFAVIIRAPVLLFAQWTPFPAEIFNFLFFEEQIYSWGIAVIFLLILTVVLFPLLRKNRTARFLAIAMLCCTLPVSASIPMNRNLLFVAIASFGLIAQFINAALAKESRLIKHRFRKLIVICMLWFLLLSHILGSAVGRIAQPIIISCARNNIEATMKINVFEELEDKCVVFINCPNPFAISYLSPYRAHYKLPLPQSFRIIATGFNMYYVRRIDENALELDIYKGNILQNYKRTFVWNVNFFKHLTESFRDCDAFPIKAGEKFEISGFTADVLEVDKTGRPTKVIYKFDRPLDDESLIWLRWDWLRKCYQPFKIPPIGRKRIIVPGPPRRQKPK